MGGGGKDCGAPGKRRGLHRDREIGLSRLYRSASLEEKRVGERNRLEGGEEDTGGLSVVRPGR